MLSIPMRDKGDNLLLILSAWVEMLRTGKPKALESILDEHVIWQGVLPDLICQNRNEVLDIMVRNRQRAFRLTRVEAQESGGRVAVSVEGPDFPDTDWNAADTPRSLVFTFEAGKVVRIQSYLTRDEAFEEAGR
jgi:hypothetical protein